MHTIRVLNYCGDYDDFNDINIIGPYPTAAERDRDIDRLSRLRGVDGSLEFEVSTVKPHTADHFCAAEAVADATDLDGVLSALILILPPSSPTAAPEPTLPGL